MSRQAAGKKAQSAGRAFEKRLEEYHERLAKAGTAYIAPRPPRFGVRNAQIIDGRRGTRWGLVVTSQETTGGDYAGPYKGGRHIELDAKAWEKLWRCVNGDCEEDQRVRRPAASQRPTMACTSMAQWA